MSMHLSSPALSLIRSKKPKVKFTKAKLKAYELELKTYNKERKRSHERQITLDEFIKLRTGMLKAPKDPFKPLSVSSNMNFPLAKIDEFKNKKQRYKC